MKPISWSVEKNALLKAERGICFEDVVFHIMAGDLLDTLEHPNQERYPNQSIHVVSIEGYVYLTPFVESDEEVFLKTIIPNRKATKIYRGDQNE
ncbi:toxin [Ectothiorhodospira haloalkaliphila]|uniref:toxin n=1 Tax=Ectothiorhodospira haloalkaliphila TaxID=421628 RepID=UPI001EE8D00C|nr:toxin [Ectothiorhodospira haloalkaliphila]MCG5524782.1 toxin [Ectothiorhodospira haloalkaliphila]